MYAEQRLTTLKSELKVSILDLYIREGNFCIIPLLLNAHMHIHLLQWMVILVVYV